MSPAVEFPFASEWGRVWLPGEAYINKLREQNMQTSFEYKGFDIHQKPYAGTFNKHESLGFNVTQAYCVTDEFGDFALPTSQQTFWSPSDAAQAIDCAEHLRKRITGLKKWPTTVAHEFNIMLCYRRRFFHVYDQLQRIKDECIAARDFDDNPREKIIDILNTLHQHVVAEWTP